MQVQPNIVLISIVPVRRDHLSCYGYPWLTTPAIDQLASEGTLFENAYATGAWTPPSHASTLTGLYPSRHRVLGSSGLRDGVETLPQILTRQGYRTAGFVNTAHMGSFKGLDRGFETFAQFGGNQPGMLWRSPHPLAERLRRWGILRKPKGSVATLQAAQAFLSERATDTAPFFLQVHFHQAHHPYTPPRRDRRRFRDETSRAADWAKVSRVNLNPHLHLSRNEDLGPAEIAAMKSLYDGELHHLDRDFVAPLLGEIDRLNLRENTVVVLTSPHGENLGDHGLSTHVGCLYDTLIRVPLILRYPPEVPAGRRVRSLAQVTDLVPTLLEIARLPRSAVPLDGVSLRPFAEAGSSHRVVFAEWAGGGFDDDLLPEGRRLYETQPEALAAIKAHRWAIRKGDFKLIRTEGAAPELFDLVLDPVEVHDLAARHPDRVEELSDDLDRIIARFDGQVGPRSVATEAVDAELRDLGYRV